MRYWSSVVFTVVLCATGAAAESVLPDGLPSGFEDLATQAKERCGEEQRPVLPMEGFTRLYDFNGDGVTDFLVESSSFRCWPEGSLIWGGTAGTAYFIYVSRADGSFERVYSASGHALKLVDMFDNARAMAVVIFHHGLYCGLSGVSSCVGAVVWDPITNQFSGVGYAPAR